MKKRVIIASVILLGAIGIALWSTHRPRPEEPTYQGKKQTFWLDEYEKQFEENGLYPEHPSKQTPSQDAIRKIGTNAIPFLLYMAECHDNRIKTILLQRLSVMLNRRTVIGGDAPDGAIHTQMRAAVGFEALGPAAKPAVPGLIRLLGSSNPDIRFSAAASLSMIGSAAKDAVPALLPHANDPYLVVQVHSVVAL